MVYFWLLTKADHHWSKHYRFTGTIDEALNEYQNKKGILIVYICDEGLLKKCSIFYFFIVGTTDQKTVNFNSLWDSFDKSLLDVPYVSIRLEKNSQGAAQFAEFCNFVIICSYDLNK